MIRALFWVFLVFAIPVGCSLAIVEWATTIEAERELQQ